VKRLLLVGTPIGNLGDLTLRAIETLRAVPTLAAEDTRRTRALLTHLAIGDKRLFSLDAHATQRDVDRLLDRVVAGEDVAFVTDAGMPAVSDPGRRLVARAAERGIAVAVVPGPSAVTAAIALSGLVDAGFRFAGFLPRGRGRRRAVLADLAASDEPVVLFEAPGRMRDTLRDLAALEPARAACVCREITKLHEEVVRGRREAAPSASDAESGEPDLGALADDWIARGASAKQVAAELARVTGRPRRELYAWVVRRRPGGR
jgi:16S rRNA (cytidine1402-2'-O)-methyltransferase